jgi:hypothetical protein
MLSDASSLADDITCAEALLLLGSYDATAARDLRQRVLQQQHGPTGDILCMTSDMLLPPQQPEQSQHPSDHNSSSNNSSGAPASVPITDANKSDLVRAAALQRLLYSRSRGLAALKKGLVDSSGLRPALMLFAGSSASFGALFFGQQYLPVDQVLKAWFSRDVPEQLAQTLLRVVSRLSEVSLRTF